MTDIVKYNNDLNSFSLGSLSKLELNLFLTICSEAVDRNTDEIEVSLSELKEKANIKRLSYEKFVVFIQKTMNNIASLGIKTYSQENDGEFTIFYPLKNVKVSPKQNKMVFKINDDYIYLFNELAKNFTEFELLEYLSIKSKYSKECYRRLKQFSTGWWKVSIENFRMLLGIPDSYVMTNINTNVLKPITEDLSGLFETFEIEKVYEKGKRGRPEVTHLIFRFVEKNKTVKSEIDYSDHELIENHPFTKLLLENNLVSGLIIKSGAFAKTQAPKIFPAYEQIERDFGMSEVEKHIKYISKQIQNKKPNNKLEYLYKSAMNYHNNLLKKYNGEG